MNTPLLFEDVARCFTKEELGQLMANYAHDLPTMQGLLERGVFTLEGHISVTERIKVVMEMRRVVETEFHGRKPKPILILPRLVKPV